jgi:SSS family transporter
MEGRFSVVDGVVLVAYLAGTTALGMYVGRKQRDATDYFVADRAIPWWAVLFSVVASETSALTFISIPGLAYLGDLGFLQIVAGYVVGRFVVAYTLLPRYYEGELVTAYALLERRFGAATRRFTSIVFMVTRALADSVRVFATAIPVSLIVGPVLSKAYAMPVAILLLGFLTVIYTYRGGMKAVVWTELLQAGVYLFGGVAALVLLGRVTPGGWGAILDAASAAGKTKTIDLYAGFDRPHTLFAGLAGGAFLSMASHGADQMIVQRLLSSRSLRDAQRALIGSGFVVFVQFALFLALGLGLWRFYEGRKFPAADAVFPTFIVERMPPGLVGLILAAIIAATMSTHAGAINSLAAATTHDIYLPLTGRSADDARTLRAGKLFALGWGTILTVGALLFREEGTPVVVIALSIASFTYGALLGAFLLGLWWKRARQRDAIAGMAVGIVVMAFVIFAKPFVLAWPWYVLLGTTITLATGTACSMLVAKEPA